MGRQKEENYQIMQTHIFRKLSFKPNDKINFFNADHNYDTDPIRQKIKEPIIWDLQCRIEKEWEWRRQLLNSIDSFPNNICRRQTSLAFWWATEATDFVAKRSAREWRRCSARNISDENQVFSSSPLLSHLLSKDNRFNICLCMVKSVFYKEKGISHHK